MRVFNGYFRKIPELRRFTVCQPLFICFQETHLKLSRYRTNNLHPNCLLLLAFRRLRTYVPNYSPTVSINRSLPTHETNLQHSHVECLNIKISVYLRSHLEFELSPTFNNVSLLTIYDNTSPKLISLPLFLLELIQFLKL